MEVSKLVSGLVSQGQHSKNVDLQVVNSSEGTKDFKSLFFEALGSVNKDQEMVSFLTEKAIISPNEVDAHDITIAMAKANMSLSITKAVTDRVVKAYQEIINMR